MTPFRKSRTTKNDRNDAEAIATAARQGNMRFVPVKTVDQQARLAWHRAREGYKTESLAVSNRLRGLLADFAVVATVGSARDFKNGRQLSAWIWQSRCFRRVQSMRAVVSRSVRISSEMISRPGWRRCQRAPWWRWRRAAAPITGPVVVSRGEDYDPDAWSKHPMVQRAADQPALAAN